MYMPPVVFAKERIDFPGVGTLVLFPFRVTKFMEPDDPYRACMEELARHGVDRNAFLIDENEQPIWRIADYKPTLPDYVAGIRRGTRPTHAVAVTFRGWILEVDLADGSTELVDRTK